MKITIIVNLFPPKWLAGTEIATCHLAKHLAKRGHEIHVITAHDKGLPFFNKKQGICVHRIIWPKIHIIGNFIFWIQIFLKIHSIKPDLVHAQDLSMGIPALLSKIFLKVPYIIWGRGTDVYHPSGDIRITAKQILLNANGILALTDDMRIKLKTIYDTEILVVPNGIDLGKYEDLIINFEKEKDRKDILFVGSLYPVKGVQYLIMAMGKILEEIPNARLILVGDGGDRRRLESLSLKMGIQKSVQFVGKVPHQEVQKYMLQADVFVLPSLSEGFPNVILEAMACGLPIVASRIGGIPDILTTNVNGYLVEVKDTEALANKILLLLKDVALRKKMSDNNKHLVKKYSWDNVIFELERLYYDQLNEK